MSPKLPCRFLAILLIAVLCLPVFSQTAGPRADRDLMADDLGKIVSGLNKGQTSDIDRMRIHPGSLIGGGSMIYTSLYHVAAMEGATSGGTWLGYDAAGAVSATDAPTIATSAASPRVSGGNTTLITWDPNSAGGQANQYVEFAGTNQLLNLQHYGFLRIWGNTSAAITAGELTLSFRDANRAIIGSAINFPAVSTTGVWQAMEFDYRTIRSQLGRTIPTYIRITHTAPGAAETLRVEQADAYQWSNGHGPVFGRVVGRVADAAMARGSLVVGVAGQTDRVTAGGSNATQAQGIVVEGWLRNGTGVNGLAIAPTADGDLVWLQMDGEVYLEVASGTTPAVGDPVAAVTATTFDDDEGAGRGFGTWREALAAGNHALVALNVTGGVADGTFGGDLTLSAGSDLTTTAGDGELNLNFTVSNASGQLIDITPAFAGGATDTLTYTIMDIAAFAPTNAAGTDTVEGIAIRALTDPGSTVNSTAILVADGWDVGLAIQGGDINLTGSAGETFLHLRTLTDATSETGWTMLLTAQDTTSSTTAQYGLYLDNAASTEGPDALLVLDNSDADDAVVDGIRFVDAGGGFTDLIDSPTLDISGAGAISGSTGYSQASGTFDIPTAALARGDIATTTKSVWIGAGVTDATLEGAGALTNLDAVPVASLSTFTALAFDADGGATGDDSVVLTWVVPTGYVTDTAVLEVYWLDPSAAAEDAGDDVVFIGTTQAVQAGEAVGAAGTAWTPVTDEVIDTGDVLNIASINIEVEDIVVGDLVTLLFEVDESASELGVAQTVTIIGWRITWTSNN